jgi:phosphate:Na+ symporter
MDLFSFIMLFGGLAFFLYGMHVMSSGLERLAGGKLEGALKKMTANRFMGLMLGAGITIAIQSSSAMTVMLVGLVNSGIMQLGQTISVIMGSNIGTTLTAWLLSMVGIESENVFISLMKPENFSLVFAFIGAVMIMMSKTQRKKDIGSIFVGFAVLMYGMKLMSDSVSPLADMPEFASMLVAFKNPIVGVLVGAVFTGIIQSSAASVGILQALAMTGNISYGMAIPIIMGQNIGTCVTALISSIGVNRNAKRVAIVHMSFNIIGTVICLILYFGIDAIFDIPFTDNPIDALGIAAVHSIFNLFTTAILLPFIKQLEKLAYIILPEKSDGKGKEEVFIDSRLLATPSVAISECGNRTNEMAEIARDMIHDATKLVNKYDSSLHDKILAGEEKMDVFEDKLGTILVKVSSQALSDADSKKVSTMLHVIGDLERLGDHAVNLLKTSDELNEKKISFSDQAKSDLAVLQNAVGEIIDLTIDSYAHGDVEQAFRVEPLEQVVDALILNIKNRHIERLQAGNCTIELGFILSDLLTNYERISDHCSNIAAAMIEIADGSFDTHRYLTGVKYGNSRFDEIFDVYAEKYKIEA